MLDNGWCLRCAGHHDVTVGSGTRSHGKAQRILCVDHDRLGGPSEDFGFEFGHLFQGVDAVDPDMVVLHIQQGGDAVAVAGVT